MSLISEAIATCSKCGKQSEVKVYKSINIADNPELEEKIRSGALFVWECPHCHTANLARYECLYHDPGRKLMVWLMPSKQLSQKQMLAIANHTRAMGGYRLRLVRDVGDMMEKLLIFGAELDDAAMEICKFVVKMEMASKNKAAAEQLEAVSLHFHHVEEKDGMKFIIFVYPGANQQMVSLSVGFNVYEDAQGIISRNPDILPKDAFRVVDQGWVASFLK